MSIFFVKLKPAETYTHTHTHTHTGNLFKAIKQIGTICFAIFSILISAPTFATGVSSTATTADCDNATLNTYSGTSNLQANWDANTIDLHWYNGDTELTVPSASQSCTYDGTLTPPATIPTKTGYTFKGWTIRGLPSEYTKLQYIEFTGDQYIDTGVTVDQTSDVDVDFQSTSDSLLWLFGARDYNGTNGIHRFSVQYVSTSTNKIWIQFDDTTSMEYGAPTGLTNQSQRLARHRVRLSGNKCYLDDNLIYTITDTYTNFSSVNTLLIGANRASSGVSGARFKGKIYSFVYNKGENRRFNGIPAKRNSDNVVGMYDTVSKTFFTNAGTGTFTAGPVEQ